MWWRLIALLTTVAAGLACRWRGGWQNASTIETGIGGGRWLKWATPAGLITMLATSWVPHYAGAVELTERFLFYALLIPAWYAGTILDWPDDGLTLGRNGTRSWWSAAAAMATRGIWWATPPAVLLGAAAWRWVGLEQAMLSAGLLLVAGALCPIWYELGWQLSERVRLPRGFRYAEPGEVFLGMALIAAVWAQGGRLG